MSLQTPQHRADPEFDAHECLEPDAITSTPDSNAAGIAYEAFPLAPAHLAKPVLDMHVKVFPVVMMSTPVRNSESKSNWPHVLSPKHSTTPELLKLLIQAKPCVIETEMMSALRFKLSGICSVLMPLHIVLFFSVMQMLVVPTLSLISLFAIYYSGSI